MGVRCFVRERRDGMSRPASLSYCLPPSPIACREGDDADCLELSVGMEDGGIPISINPRLALSHTHSTRLRSPRAAPRRGWDEDGGYTSRHLYVGYEA